MTITYLTLVDALQDAYLTNHRGLATYWEIPKDLKAQLSLVTDMMGHHVLQVSKDMNDNGTLYTMLGIPVRWADENADGLPRIIFDKPKRIQEQESPPLTTMSFATLIDEDALIEIRVFDMDGSVQIHSLHPTDGSRLVLSTSAKGFERLRRLIEAADWRVSDFTIEG